MTESFAAIAFYVGLAALVFGSIRLARASLERRSGREVLGIGALALALVCFTVAVLIFVGGPRGVLPF